MKRQKQRHSDEEISVMLKNRIAEALEKKAVDVNTLVQVTNAYAKLRSVELKQEEGEFGSDLPPAEAAQPLDLGTTGVRQ